MFFDVVLVEAKGRTSSARIRDGKLVIRLSRFVREAEKKALVERFTVWARKKFQALERPDFVLPQYRDGGRIVTHNKVYDLVVKVSSGKVARVGLKEGVLTVYLPAGADERKLRDLVDAKIMRDQIAYLREVVEKLNLLYFQARYNEVRFRRVQSRYGSCSRGGNLMIAYSLLFAPRAVFEYVCIHELAHLVEFNHSARFWALVEAAMADYRDQEKWLKANGMMLG